MIKRLVAAMLSATVAVSATGCAAIFAPGPDPIHVSTDPEGATVKLDAVPVGKTPCLVAVPRSSKGVFTFELPGFETATLDLDKVANGLTFLNLLWGVYIAPVGLIIDAATGNIGKYSSQPRHVLLEPSPRVEP